MTQEFSYPKDKYLLLGIVAKPHGLKGEVKLQSYSDNPETLLDYSSLVLVARDGKISLPLKVMRARVQGKQVIVQFNGISDRNIAESLQGSGILIDKNDLSPIDQNEYYWYQLYDKRVITEEGLVLGQVKSIFSNGAHDIMVVEDGVQEYLIPLTGNIIKEMSGDEILINPPPGLLEMNTE